MRNSYWNFALVTENDAFGLKLQMFLEDKSKDNKATVATAQVIIFLGNSQAVPVCVLV